MAFAYYQENGTPVYYLYETNLQGDVVAIYDSNGAKVLSFTYDAWGNFTQSYTGVDSGAYLADYFVNATLFRYRGYIYENETGLYYLQSRYYDPQTGRFISMDSVDYLGAGGDIASFNLYAYCGNNPVMYEDPSGHSVLSVIAAVWLSGIVIHASTLVRSYEACVIASIWDEEIRADMNAIGWNPFNTDEKAVLDSKKVSFYKGSVVFRHSIPDITSCGVFGMIILNRSETSSNADSFVTLNHEWGHNMQELLIGTPAYLVLVGLPSVIYCSSGDYLNYNGAVSDRMYYSKIWERTADFLGGVNRNNYDSFWTIDNFKFW